MLKEQGDAKLEILRCREERNEQELQRRWALEDKEREKAEHKERMENTWRILDNPSTSPELKEQAQMTLAKWL